MIQKPFTTKALHSLMHIVLLSILHNIWGGGGSLMICLGQGGLRSPSALSSIIFVFFIYLIFINYSVNIA